MLLSLSQLHNEAVTAVATLVAYANAAVAISKMKFQMLVILS